jgi:uncharacterized protein (UPF0333 family)
MKKSKKNIGLIILIPILVLAVAVGGAYFYLQAKLNAGGDSARAEVVNAMIKVVTHPKEMKKMMDSITITDEDAGTSSKGKEISADTAQRSENTSTSSEQKNTPAPGSSSAEDSGKSKAASNNASISSFEYMKSHYNEYELLSTGAKNLGGNTYRLTATVKHKTTGKINTVTVTTQLSESMKQTLRKYRK